ncbi:MAG: hypothetical protein H6876_06295 [Hyphomicrobiaceae bacterium]|nr:hypothetical protein [Hyphomicrobiaceae bacterium]
MSNDVRHLTELQVAELTTISVQTLRRWRADPTRPGPAWLKLGPFKNSRVAYPLRQLTEWLARHERQCTSQRTTS